ncbi:hypothetical protein [Xenorhabdus szentirmaii]|uniref:hypothetical protein n=1 Tax=Xenorhabdus szentirmaii TaxID=290112 RepID=UPI0005716BCC|nr:hypothetical protein [Xenorhabdus szentirmaii]
MRNSPFSYAVHLNTVQRLTSHNTHYVRPPLISAAGRGAQGCAFCCQPLSPSSANTALNLNTGLAFGQSDFDFNRLAASGQSP